MLFEIERAYYQAKPKNECPFYFMSRKMPVGKSAYLNFPIDKTGETILHGYSFIKYIYDDEWLIANSFSHNIVFLIADKDYGFALYRELIRNDIFVEQISLEKVHRCSKCNRRLEQWGKDLLNTKSTPSRDAIKCVVKQINSVLRFLQSAKAHG